MLSWSIGRVTVTRIVEMEIPVPAGTPFLPEATPEILRTMPWLYPHYVTASDALVLSVHALLVDAPGLRLVVDTCIGNDRPRAFTGGQALSTPFLAHLTEAGWTREGVDAVVCTHLHVDHVGWNTMLEGGRWIPTFPNARYLIGAKEYEHWKAEGDDAQQVILGDSIQPIFDAGLAELVEPDYRLSPEIWLESTPGHTPGHVSVMIESDGERAMISGDFLHHPCQMAHPAWCAVSDIDPPLARETRAAWLNQVADTPTLFIGTHFPAPTAGYVRRDGAAFRLES
ncbi:MAG TPA: MBL fold metallo-hydrolase [Caulobacteraceae bacterium]|jgi:glyoxylase-like metal-dependent hydrolase (beta-lactamase superfamily II)